MKLGNDLALEPAHRYTLEELLAVDTPAAPTDFAAFWQARYAQALQVQPHPRIKHTDTHAGYEVYDLRHVSTGNWLIHGWVLIPQQQAVTSALIFGHGYGGCDAPDYRLQPSGVMSWLFRWHGC